VRVIALIDGEHHPDVARAALDELAQQDEIAAVLFAGGEEKVAAGVLDDSRAHYGREVALPGRDVRAALADLAQTEAADAVVDLSGDPVLDADTRMELAVAALHAGLRYRAPGMVLEPPPALGVEPHTGGIPVIGVIGTGKRTGKTALGTHLARLLRDAGERPAVVSMGRGGPPQPVLVRAAERLDLAALLQIARAGGHAASDYLEDAVLAGVTTVGCRRCGEGPAGQTFTSTVVDGLSVARAEEPGVIVLEGSGAALPPVRPHATVCVTAAARAHVQALSHLGPMRLLRSDLVVVLGARHLSQPDRAALGAGLARWVARDRVLFAELWPEPSEPMPARSRVACFVTAPADAEPHIRAALARHDLEPLVFSVNLARRELLQRDVEAAVAAHCGVFLCELKAAAIDLVAEAAQRSGARVVFLRNRPVAESGEADLDQALMDVAHEARARAAR
jgi:cyclic 2,3-diphosphoglycerate synthase